MKFGFLMVLYNKKLEDSLTYKYLKKISNLLIIDNTIDPKIIDVNNNFCKKNKIDYIAKKENLGLSKAYNIGIDFFKNKNIDYLVLLDDDTDIGDKYIDTVLNYSYQKKTIYTPLIFDQNNKLVNPFYHNDNYLIEYIKQRNYNSKEKLIPLIGSNKVFAINSGMVIPFEIFDYLKYDENIFLDCVDYYFCRACYKLGYKIDILPVEIKQSYSVMDIANKSFEQNIPRLTIRLKDTKAYDKKTYFLNKSIFVSMYFLKTKDFRYFKYLLK